jgi:hypothetical protein
MNTITDLLKVLQIAHTIEQNKLQALKGGRASDDKRRVRTKTSKGG